MPRKHGGIGRGFRFGYIVGGVNVVHRLEMIGDTDSLQDPVRVIRIRICIDNLSAGDLGERGIHARVGLDGTKVDIVHIGEIAMRVEPVMMHQPGKRRAEFEEVFFLNAVRFNPVDVEHLGDKAAHACVDLIEQMLARRIEAIVEIEDPGFSGQETFRHRPINGERGPAWQGQRGDISSPPSLGET